MFLIFGTICISTVAPKKMGFGFTIHTIKQLELFFETK